MTDDDLLPLPPEAQGDAPGRGRLDGKRILVVGAGTAYTEGMDDPPVGNGQAISRLSAREGAEVVCADIDAESAGRTLAAIEAEGGSATVIQADVSDADACAALVEQAGPIDGLVCNIGIGGGMGVKGTSVEDWDRVFAVNLRAHFLLAKAALGTLRPGGSIVLVSSVAGLVPGSRIPSYDASKAGLFGLSRQVAAEAARKGGIRSNVLVPGLIDTPLGRLASAGRPGRTKAPVALGRQGTAWEVAYAALFLLSDESSFVTGTRLVVDGGMAWQ
jgi:NAD(P)-dependent dehydrogenase (short-subunit alcohol dehydrogenase family)